MVHFTRQPCRILYLGQSYRIWLDVALQKREGYRICSVGRSSISRSDAFLSIYGYNTLFGRSVKYLLPFNQSSLYLQYFHPLTTMSCLFQAKDGDLWLQKKLAGGLAPLDIIMRPRHFLEWVDFMNPHVHLVLQDKVPQLIRVCFELLSRGHVVEECRPTHLGVLC